uniref:Uncharacterized protein n=1 Tax=Cannabis sativa TaxID=3483 RepID=A0A803NFL4_CANSA
MTEYLKQKRIWADSLALAGNPYPEKHLISNVLSGLDAEYLFIVVQIESREHTTWQKLQNILLGFDGRLERLNAFLNNNKQVNSPTANFAQRPSGSNNMNPSGAFCRSNTNQTNN